MPGPLRVLLLNNFLPPRGGAEAHVAQVRGLLAAAGHAADLLAPGDSDGIAALRDRVLNPAVRRLVAGRLRDLRPDVVHVHNFLRRLSVEPFLAARDAGVPVLLTAHDYQLFCPRTWAVRAGGEPCPRPSLPLCALGNCRGGLEGIAGRAAYAATALRRPWAVRVVRRCADRVVAPSAALAGRLATVLRREVPVLPHPFPEAAPFEPPPGPDLLFLGRVAPEKGVLELLAALAAAGPPAAALRLTVAGDGPSLGAARDAARARGLGDRVRYEGWVGADRIPGLLRSHGALVIPSVWMENSPVVVHEALAAGRPVLGTTRGGVGELVEDGKQGILFDPLDRAAFAAALARWAGLEAGARTTMALAARDRAAAGGGPSGWLPRLVEEYHRTIHDAGVRRAP